MAESKLNTFLEKNKLNPKRLLAVSHELETLKREDRKIKLAKKQAKKGGDAAAAPAEGEEKKAPGKPRSGRPVTPRALTSALAGGTISGPTKQRILRAVNFLLEQKKKEKVDLKALF